MTITDDQTAARRRGDTATTRGDGTRARSAAAQRALDRRRKRLAAELVTEERRRGGRVRSPRTESPAAGFRSLITFTISPIRAANRIPFAIVVVGLLVAGLALTLWLTTKSAQDSYQLGVVRDQNELLSDRRDALKKAYESGDSAPELSDKAGALGMIPGNDKARMVIGPDGKETIVGEITPAVGPKAPSMNDTPTTPSRTPATGTAPTPGSQGTPITPGGTATTAPGTSQSPDSTSATGQTPANPAVPPTFSNVLPSTGGAPGSNSGQTR